MALNKLTADALVDGTLSSDTLATASVTNDKLNSNIISSQTAIGVVDSTNDTLLIYDNSTTSLKKVAVNSLLSTSDVTEGTNLYYTDERVDDRVDKLIVGGNNITATYNDAAGTLTIDGQPGYADSDVAAYLGGNLDTSIIPDADATYDIGSASYKIRDLYLSNNSLHIGENTLSTNVSKLLFNGEDVMDYANITSKPTTLTGYGITDGYADSDVATYLSGNGYATSTSIIADITASAPSTLDTLNELAAALGDDPNFATPVTNSIATKMPLSGGIFTGAVTFGDYTLPTSDGTVGQIMTTDGAGAVTFAAAGGGGSPDLFAENYDGTTTKPIATGTNAVAIGTNAVSSNTDSVALGGDSLASGYKSFAAVIGNTYSAYGASGFAAISIGMQSRATASSTTAVGPSAFASGSSSVALGFGSTASGSYSIAIGDSGAEATNATAIGQYALSSTAGKYSYASGRFASVEGSAQTGTFVLRSDTTDATPEALTTNNSTAGTTNQVILPNNSAYFFRGTIIARQSAATGTDVGAWEIKGAISREANAASTVLVKSTIDDFNVPTGWVVALTADTTNGGLAITVTGAAATNIRWVSTVTTSEVTY